MPSTEQTDEAVARDVQQGNSDIFGVLVDRYQEKLLRYGRKFLARKEDIEDIVQDVFVSAYQNIQSFDTTQRFSPWVYRIAHNAFVNTLRRNQLAPLLIDFDTLVAHPTYDDPAESEREQREMRTLLDEHLEQVDPKYREVLILYYFEEMSYRDIADVLRIPTGTVGIRIKRARAALKKKLTKLP